MTSSSSVKQRKYQWVELVQTKAAEMEEERINTTEKTSLLPGKSVQQPQVIRPSKRARLLGHNRWTFRRRVLGVTALQVVAVIAIAVAVTLSLTLRNRRASTAAGYSGSYTSAAVATDAAQCSQVGVDILKKGGSAVDSAIASLLCVGVMNPQSTGIGGGGFMVYYNATSGLSTAIDFRETAPGTITDEDMKRYIKNDKSTVFGGMAIGVPGEIRGIGEAWNRFGKLPWKDLFEPSIKLAREGFTVSNAVARAISGKEEYLSGNQFPGLKKLLAPDGKFLKEGDNFTNAELAKTLELLASNGADYFYNSSFTEEMVKELKDGYGCLLSVEDFQNYNADVKNATVSEYGDMRVHSVPPPASGVVLALMLNILSGYNDLTLDDNGLSYHRIVEAFKFSYAQHSRLGDPAFNKTVNKVVEYMLNTTAANWMRSRITDDRTHDTEYYMEEEAIGPSSHGTTHLVVLAENGDAVSVTSTINLSFGSLVRSTTNGIIFNNELDDFGVPGRNNSFNYPPSVPNYIQPNKRPLSSTVPTILEKDGSVVIAVGAAGGSLIPTATAQLIIDVLNFNLTLEEAITQPRIHHQLLPDVVLYEPTLAEKYITGLQQRGHELDVWATLAVVQAIYVDKQQTSKPIQAVSDPRKGGAPAGY